MSEILGLISAVKSARWQLGECAGAQNMTVSCKLVIEMDLRITELEGQLEDVKKVWVVNNRSFSAHFSTKEKADRFVNAGNAAQGMQVTEIDVF